MNDLPDVSGNQDSRALVVVGAKQSSRLFWRWENEVQRSAVLVATWPDLMG